MQSLRTLVQSPELTYLDEGESKLFEFSSDLYRRAIQVYKYTYTKQLK